MALGQGVRVRADAFDIRKLRARHGGQTVRNLLDVRAVDAQVVLEQQVVDLADRACGRIFDRNYAYVSNAVAHGPEHLLPGRNVDRLALREQRARRELLIRARHTLIVDGFGVERGLGWVEGEAFRFLSQQLAVLIFAARADHALQQRRVLEPQLVIHARGALLKDLRLAVGLVDLVVVLGLGLCDLERERHPLQKQRTDLLIDLVDVLPDLGQFTHSRSPPAKGLPARWRRRPRRPAPRA